MKTKIIISTALLAFIAVGCNKENEGSIRLFAENMTTANNGKYVIDPDNPVYSVQWVAGESIDINGHAFEIEGNESDGCSIDVAGYDIGAPFYAVYPGGAFGGNDVTVINSAATASITLNSLVLDYRNDGSHSVAFPMGTKASEGDNTMTFKHLTSGFRLTLNATVGAVELTRLKVIVYGTASPAPVVVNGVSYTVQWASRPPSLPTGVAGTITDLDVSYASEMYFDLKTNGMPGVEFNSLKCCIPVTLATVRRITVVGYNGSDEVFSKSSVMNSGNVTLERGKMYPIAPITVD